MFYNVLKSLPDAQFFWLLVGFKQQRTSESCQELLQVQIAGTYLQEFEFSTGCGQAQEPEFFTAS